MEPYHPDIPLEELTPEEDDRMIELIMRVVELNNMTATEFVKSQEAQKQKNQPS